MKKLVKALIKLIINFIKICIKVCIFCVFVFILMAGIDLIQVHNGDYPVFIITRSMNEKRIETFQGFFHTITRKVYASTSEPLTHSSNIKYSIFTLKFPIKYKNKNRKITFKVEPQELDTCTNKSELYYADLDIKVYTYCLEDIIIYQDGKKTKLDSLLEKDNSILEDIDVRMDYKGMNKEIQALEYVSNSEEFSNN